MTAQLNVHCESCDAVFSVDITNLITVQRKDGATMLQMLEGASVPLGELDGKWMCQPCEDASW